MFEIAVVFARVASSPACRAMMGWWSACRNFEAWWCISRQLEDPFDGHTWLMEDVRVNSDTGVHLNDYLRESDVRGMDWHALMIEKRGREWHLKMFALHGNGTPVVLQRGSRPGARAACCKHRGPTDAKTAAPADSRCSAEPVGPGRATQ